MKHIGKVFTYLILAVNAFFVGILLLTAYSPHIHPVVHPVESCMGLTFPIFLIINLCFLIFWLLVRYKFALLPILGFAFCYPQIRTYFPINIHTSDIPEGSIKILSYNIMSFGNMEKENGKNPVLEYIRASNADGKKILNYKVGYQYEVINKEFSAKEDFPSGGYNIEKSNAAMSLMKIIKNAFEGDFSKYLAEGKQVKVIITGSADASPIRGRIAYDGRYGEFMDEPYYKDGNLDNITVTKTSGITQNEQLALLRAAGVQNYIDKNVTTLNNTKNEYEYHVEVAKERGGEFRKINVEFVIMDAFQQ